MSWAWHSMPGIRHFCLRTAPGLSHPFGPPKMNPLETEVSVKPGPPTCTLTDICQCPPTHACTRTGSSQTHTFTLKHIRGTFARTCICTTHLHAHVHPRTHHTGPFLGLLTHSLIHANTHTHAHVCWQALEHAAWHAHMLRFTTHMHTREHILAFHSPSGPLHRPLVDIERWASPLQLPPRPFPTHQASSRGPASCSRPSSAPQRLQVYPPSRDTLG